MLKDILQRLADANIGLAPIELDRYLVFERDGFVALVERTKDDNLGRVGTAGLLTPSGLAPLVRRSGGAVFPTTSGDVPASDDLIRGLRSFQRDLEFAITGPSGLASTPPINGPEDG